MGDKNTVNDIVSRADELLEWQEDFYKDLHSHPELSMEEERTRGVIADKLDELGISNQEIGGGVVGTVENGDGPTVMLRADFDGLPVAEETGLDYAADPDAGVMHACGHDTHVTALMGMAQLMVESTDAWSGTLHLLFQPGEETGAGAQAMLDDALVDKVSAPDVVLGQHVFGMDVPAGSLAIAPGSVMSAAVSMRIKVFGDGSHGSMPHLGVDPVVLASSIVTRLQAVISREIAPGDFGVITVGSISAGKKANVIADSATLEINIRAYDEDKRDFLVDAVHRVVDGQCAISRSPKDPEYEEYDHFPLTVNDEDTTAQVKAALVDHFGEDKVFHTDPVTASEDFSHVPDAYDAPYCYWFFGGLPEGESIPNHSPKFAPVMQPTLRTGTEALVAAACAFLG